MGGIARALFGGGDDAKKAAEAQRREAERQRQIAAVANDRQLAQLNEQEQRSTVSRRAPRGRRLFSTDEQNGGAASTLA